MSFCFFFVLQLTWRVSAVPMKTAPLLFAAVYFSPPFTIRRHFLSSSITLKPNPKKPHAPRGAPFPFSFLYLNITLTPSCYLKTAANRKRRRKVPRRMVGDPQIIVPSTVLLPKVLNHFLDVRLRYGTNYLKKQYAQIPR